MTTGILKLKNNAVVCKVCDFIEMMALMALPIAIPLFIMYVSTL